MEITRFGPDDARPARGSTSTSSNAARAVDSPWAHPDTVNGAEGRFRYGWDGEVETPFLGLVDGVPVAVGSVATTDYDNLHLAWLGVQVHPEHRRRGLRHRDARGSRRRGEARGRTSIGIDGWDDEGARAFAARHGLEEKSRAIQRRQLLAELDWAEIERLHAQARRRGVGVRDRPPRGADAG